ncbi:hypothetical protein EBZ80_26900 [bacterium]|nr:hypothetical protein [bacterium]
MTEFKEYHVFSTKTGSGSFSASANIDNPTISFGDPAPRGYSVASDSSGQVHFVATETNTLLTYWTYSFGTWTSSTAGALLNKASDGTATCDHAEYPAIAFDRSMTAHGLHVVYYCVSSFSAGELVHLWYDQWTCLPALRPIRELDLPSTTDGRSLPTGAAMVR